MTFPIIPGVPGTIQDDFTRPQSKPPIFHFCYQDVRMPANRNFAFSLDLLGLYGCKEWFILSPIGPKK